MRTIFVIDKEHRAITDKTTKDLFEILSKHLNTKKLRFISGDCLKSLKVLKNSDSSEMTLLQILDKMNFYLLTEEEVNKLLLVDEDSKESLWNLIESIKEGLN